MRWQNFYHRVLLYQHNLQSQLQMLLIISEPVPCVSLAGADVSFVVMLFKIVLWCLKRFK